MSKPGRGGRGSKKPPEKPDKAAMDKIQEEKGALLVSFDNVAITILVGDILS